IVDYAYNERPAETNASFISKIQEYQDTKRDLRGDLDLYYDWPNDIYPGTHEEYREFYTSYWEKNEAAKKAEKEREKAEQEARKERLGTISIQKDQANLVAHSNYTGIYGHFSEGLCVVNREEVSNNGSANHYYGVVDTTGTLVIPMQDHLIQECHDGALCFSEKKDNSMYYGYIDRNGKQILPAVATWHNDFSEGFAAVETLDGNYYIDNTGKKYDLPEGVIGKSFCNGYAVVTKGINQYGLINKNMEIVVPMEYENVRNFNSKGIGPVKKDDLYYLINTDGKRLIEQGYESIELAVDSDYFVARNTEGLTGIIDPDGNESVPCVHKALNSGGERLIRNGLLPVWREEGKSIDFINTQGEIVISGNWMATTGFYNGFAGVTDAETQVNAVIDITGKVVEINKTGTTVDTFWYGGLNNMFVTLRGEGEKKYYSLFNTDGTRLLGNCEDIRCGEGYIAVIQDGYFTIFDEELNTVY
ncbi:MAG: WG repeat-containing protein, partial [Clostridiales bacterium]|nr:WG repeat-containing protein [Clostridiales bacterium]